MLVPALGGRAMEAAVLVVSFAFWSIVNLRGVTLGRPPQRRSRPRPSCCRSCSSSSAARSLSIPANLAITTMPAAADVARMSLLLIFAFAGIEVALVPSGEVRDPARTVPRALALAMIGITAMYIALQVVSQGVLGSALADAKVSPLADVAAAALGGWAGALLLAGAIDLDVRLSRRHDAVDAADALRAGPRRLRCPRRWRPFTPSTARRTWRSSCSPVITLARRADGHVREARDPRQRVGAGAVLRLRPGLVAVAPHGRRRRRHSPLLRVPFAGLMPWLACGVILWLLSGLTRDEVIGFAACVALASVPYVLTRRATGSATRSPGRG